LASSDAERLRPDSNRGWWICNPSPDSPKEQPQKNLGSDELLAYRPAYRGDWEREEIIDRRLAGDPRLAQIAELWTDLSSDNQCLILNLVMQLC